MTDRLTPEQIEAVCVCAQAEADRTADATTRLVLTKIHVPSLGALSIGNRQLWPRAIEAWNAVHPKAPTTQGDG